MGSVSLHTMQVLHVLTLSLMTVCISCLELGHTWPPWAEECEDGLPFDGSIVPDCREYVDDHWDAEPHFLKHETNCSRYWSCGPTYQTCLYECERCWDNPMWCNGQWAKTFNPRFQGIYGPVCEWPTHMECQMPVIGLSLIWDMNNNNKDQFNH